MSQEFFVNFLSPKISSFLKIFIGFFVFFRRDHQ
jgi:hypothetical protein